MSKLSEFVEIFEDIYARFSSIQIENALKSISDLMQLPEIILEDDDFFIDAVNFIGQDFDSVEIFMSEKLAVVMTLVNLALNRRKAELGIYFDPAEIAVDSVIGKERKDKLDSDLAAISWFITGDLNTSLDSYFLTSPEYGLAIIIGDKEEMLVDPGVTVHDEANRLDK